jgi:hypothetical protein
MAKIFVPSDESLRKGRCYNVVAPATRKTPEWALYWWPYVASQEDAILAVAEHTKLLPERMADTILQAFAEMIHEVSYQALRREAAPIVRFEVEPIVKAES